MKRTTGFVKKVKSLTGEMATSLVASTDKLNLARYVSEIVSAVAEAPLKLRDVAGAAQFCCAMHQRYDEFTSPLKDTLSTTMHTIYDGITDRAAAKTEMKRCRVLFRLCSQLLVYGVFSEPSVVLKMVRKLIAFPHSGNGSVVPISNEALGNLPILLTVFGSKSVGYILTGIVSRSNADMIRSQAAVGTEASHDEVLSTGASPGDISILPTVARERLTTMLRWCLESATARIRKEYLELKKRVARNDDEIINRGSLSDRSKELLEAHQKSFDKLFEYTKELANALAEPNPELPDDDGSDDEKMPEVELALWDRRKLNDGNASLSDEAWAYGDE